MACQVSGESKDVLTYDMTAWTGDSRHGTLSAGVGEDDWDGDKGATTAHGTFICYSCFSTECRGVRRMAWLCDQLRCTGQGIWLLQVKWRLSTFNTVEGVAGNASFNPADWVYESYDFVLDHHVFHRRPRRHVTAEWQFSCNVAAQ